MTIQNAKQARELSQLSRWSLEKLLTAIEEAATEGKDLVIVSGELSSQLQNELTMRGFLFAVQTGDTHHTLVIGIAMTLSEALPHVFDNGQRIQRRLWSPSIFVALDSAILCIKGYSHSGPDDGKFHPWTITESDWYADDWEVVE